MSLLSDISALVAERLAALQLTQQKLILSLILFFILTLIYSTYLKEVITTLLTRPDGEAILRMIGNFPTLFKFFFFTGWPFVVLVFIDETWNSKDAARVVLLAFVVSVSFWFHRYGVNCPFAALLFFFPFILTAAVCHGLSVFVTSRC